MIDGSPEEKKDFTYETSSHLSLKDIKIDVAFKKPYDILLNRPIVLIGCRTRIRT